MLVPGAPLWRLGKMMNWFGLNIPLMVVLVCCWAVIPLWHVLTRWGAEFKAKHAEVAARAVAVPVLVQPAPAPAAACGAGCLAGAGVAERAGKGKPGFALGRLSVPALTGQGSCTAACQIQVLPPGASLDPRPRA